MIPNRIFALALACAAPAALAATGDEHVETQMGADRFVVGGAVSRTEAVAGDLIAAGGEVELDSPVQGDTVVAGGNVRVGGTLGQNLYAAGGRVMVNAQVERNVRIAGGRVEVQPTAAIKGNVTAAGGHVAIRGAVSGYVQAAGGDVVIDGPIGGDVTVNAGRLELGPKAAIAGAVRYRGRGDLVQDPAAKVAGGIDRHTPERHATGTTSSWQAPWSSRGWLWSAGLIVLAALVAVAVPPWSMRVSSELRTHPGLALLFGFIALVCIPVAAVVLLLTVVGIPLAMLVAMAYLILLAVGYVSTAVAFGDAGLRAYRSADAVRSSWRLLATIVAMLVLTLVARVPYVGSLIVFVAMIAGVGAILMAVRPRKAEAAPA